MRVLIIGSNHFDKEADIEQKSNELFTAAYQIGLELGKREGHTILICSESPNTVDYHVFQGVKEVSNKTQVEIHVSDNKKIPYKSDIEEAETHIILKIHLSSDYQVVHMEAMADADALLILGGSSRSTRTGVAAYMLGKTVIPIGSFGGAGRDVWSYASSKREEFYKGGLTDAEIDKLAEPWKDESSAKFVVKMLEKVRIAEVKSAIPRFAFGE